MKQIILLVSCLALTVGANAQELKLSDVPESIKKSFEKRFPNTNVDRWEKEGTNYEAEYHQNKLEGSAIFDGKGKFIEVEEKINLTEMPIVANEYCTKTYIGYKLEGVAKITTADGKIMYEAEMKNGKEQFNASFDDKGNFVKKGIVETKK